MNMNMNKHELEEKITNCQENFKLCVDTLSNIIKEMSTECPEIVEEILVQEFENIKSKIDNLLLLKNYNILKLALPVLMNSALHNVGILVLVYHKKYLTTEENINE